ncbi:nuclease-related domain-containing protein [Enterobacter hormaechei]|uniref:nuclease-related domain-containing protein n=1 Tax=Enterobacter hormaechei TaxID=158836 RepID=UPI0039C0836E
MDFDIVNIAGVTVICLLAANILCILDLISNDQKEAKTVEYLTSELAEENAILLSDLTLPVKARRTTQIDHVLFMPHGIYVIEEKNYVGTLKGNIDDAMWTKLLGKRRLKLQNPFKQNVGHIDGIRKAVGDNDLPCINVVLINGKCRFSGTQPEWLCMGSDELIAKLKSRANSMVFSTSQLERYHSQLLTVRKKPGLITDLEHIAHLNRRHKVRMKPTYLVTYHCISLLRFFYRWF